MKDYLKCTNDNVQEYIDVIYSVMHDEDEIEKAKVKTTYLSKSFYNKDVYQVEEEDFNYWRKLRNENKKLFEIIQLLKEYAIISSIEQGEE